MPAKLYYLYRCHACDKLFTSEQSYVRTKVINMVVAKAANDPFCAAFIDTHKCNDMCEGIAHLVGSSTVRIEH